MRTTLEAGKLNRRIDLMALSDTVDSMGQKTNELKKIATVWAEFYPIRSAEKTELNKTQGVTTYQCYIRYRNDLDTTCYINYKGEQYDIISLIDVNNDNRLLDIKCQKHTDKEQVRADGN